MLDASTTRELLMRLAATGHSASAPKELVDEAVLNAVLPKLDESISPISIFDLTMPKSIWQQSSIFRGTMLIVMQRR